MKARELYVVSFGALHLLLFFRLLTIVEQVLMLRVLNGKEHFMAGFGVFSGLAIFILFFNTGRIIQLITTPEEKVGARVATVAQMSMTILSFILISTLLKNFILFR